MQMPLDFYRQKSRKYFSAKLRKRAGKAIQRAQFALLKTPRPFHGRILERLNEAYANGAKGGMWSAWEALDNTAQSFSCFAGPVGLSMSADMQQITEAAEKWSKDISHLVRGVLKNLDEAETVNTTASMHEEMSRLYFDCCSVVELSKIELPKITKTKNSQKVFERQSAAIRRMMDARWWCRRIRCEHARWVESTAQRHGFIGRNVGEAYVSAEALQRYRAQRRNNRDVLSGLVAVCDDLNAEIPLLDAVDASPANPLNRRNEMMTRLRGLEQWADSNGMVAHFWTITCPSRFHKWTVNRQGKTCENSKYSAETPRDAQAYLRVMWAKVRAEFGRKGISIIGMRVAEPHHDGCPHWHILAFGLPRSIDAAKTIMQRYALEDSPEEPGAKSRRFVVEVIDREKGSAVAYISKYVAKHIATTGTSLDGETDKESGLLFEQNEQERSQGDRPEALDRVCAWASLWGIRQFQFFRAGKVSAWRELRRLSKEDGMTGDLVSAWQAANAESFGGMGKADWGDFLKALERHPIELIKDEKENFYGELLPIISGIECGGKVYITRPHRWRIEQRSKAAENSRFIGAWTCDNKCTDVSGKKITHVAGNNKKRRLKQ